MTADAASLRGERCQACSGETPRLGAGEIAQLRAQLSPEWRVEERRLLRQQRFSNFASAFARATQIADLAESEGHHPDLCVGWGRLDIELTTHAISGLSRNDFILAAKIDALD